MRVLPLRWILEINANQIKPTLKTNISYLIKEKIVLINSDISGEKYLILSKKGYSLASQFFSPGYAYSSWNNKGQRTGSIHQEHNFMIFRSILNIILDGEKVDSILTHYDQGCKIRFGSSRGGSPFRVEPDSLIEQSNNTHLAFECDTGTENYDQLYDKILKYLIVANSFYNSTTIEKLEVYLMFKTQQRIENLIHSKSTNTNNLFSFFGSHIHTFQQTSSNKSITTLDIAKITDDDRISFIMEYILII
ncbi:MAG: hypothetical protein HC932_00045 [Thermales bacterium]|nr:hypothetical protein [Thermales bacterium]